MISKPLSRETIDWIRANAKADVMALRLKYADDKERMFAIMQIDCRRKAASKLSRTLECEEFVFPTIVSAEQCTGDALAAVHAGMAVGGSVLDMSCGLGIDAFAMAARGFDVTAIDINSDVAQALALNAESLGLSEKVTALCADSAEWLAETSRRFDTIFIDPSRRDSCGRRTYALAECAPDVTKLLPLLRQRCRRLIVKTSPMLDISALAAELGPEARIVVTGTATECKELIAVLDFGGEALHESLAVEAVTVLPDGRENRFSFTRDEEKEASATIGVPAVGDILYEPYPAVMKAMPFRLLSQRKGAARLDANTPLYTSPSLIAEFPGTAMHVEKVLDYGRAALRELGKSLDRVNYTCRNFPIAAQALVARAGIKEGGDRRLFATTASGRRTLILARPF